MPTDPWSGRPAARARSIVALWLPMDCARCGQIVDGSTPWVVGHKKSRAEHPELTFEPSNWRPEHRACSDASAQSVVQAKAYAQGVRDAQAGLASPSTPGPGFPPQRTPGTPPPRPVHTLAPVGPTKTRNGLSWSELTRTAPDWLRPYLDVPADAAAPLWVSSVHPDAVGSYGPAAIEWMEENLIERGRPLRFRWWQKLAIVRQLEHRADGSLCWRVILESGPRRIGKSVRLRAVALWRLAFGHQLFEPEQLIVHTGKDLAIVREVLKKAFNWAETEPGWACKKGMTEPEVSFGTTNRWVVRSKDATTGYDCCLALVDECWDVPPASVDDDLEPSMLERVSPQLLLTSTAHRRATSLMRGRLLDALSVDDGETLLLVWAAPADADPGDPNTWRAASAHWSDERNKLVAAKHEKALAGQSDPEFDDPDPMEGFKAQYLNVWRLKERKAERGEKVVESEPWSALVAPVPNRTPDAAAIESWVSDGYSVALAWRAEGAAVVSVSDHPTLTSAAAAITGAGFRGRATVGASLMDDPALQNLRRSKGTGRVGTAASDLRRLLGEGALRHDGTAHLTGQVLGLRTIQGVDGPRMASAHRADAVKAAVWAVNGARSRSSKRTSRIILPTSSAR